MRDKIVSGITLKLIARARLANERGNNCSDLLRTLKANLPGALPFYLVDSNLGSWIWATKAFCFDVDFLFEKVKDILGGYITHYGRTPETISIDEDFQFGFAQSKTSILSRIQ